MKLFRGTTTGLEALEEDTMKLSVQPVDRRILIAK